MSIFNFQDIHAFELNCGSSYELVVYWQIECEQKTVQGVLSSQRLRPKNISKIIKSIILRLTRVLSSSAYNSVRAQKVFWASRTRDAYRCFHPRCYYLKHSQGSRKGGVRGARHPQFWVQRKQVCS